MDNDGRRISRRLAGQEVAPSSDDPFANNDLSGLLSTTNSLGVSSTSNSSIYVTSQDNHEVIDLLDVQETPLSQSTHQQQQASSPQRSVQSKTSTSSSSRMTNHSLQIDTIERAIESLQNQLERINEMPQTINTTIESAIATAMASATQPQMQASQLES